MRRSKRPRWHTQAHTHTRTHAHTHTNIQTHRHPQAHRHTHMRRLRAKRPACQGAPARQLGAMAVSTMRTPISESRDPSRLRSLRLARRERETERERRADVCTGTVRVRDREAQILTRTLHTHAHRHTHTHTHIHPLSLTLSLSLSHRHTYIPTHTRAYDGDSVIHEHQLAVHIDGRGARHAVHLSPRTQREKSNITLRINAYAKTCVSERD
jgi:hypothetical protein